MSNSNGEDSPQRVEVSARDVVLCAEFGDNCQEHRSRNDEGRLEILCFGPVGIVQNADSRMDVQ
jgi:hypothetical protein